MALILKPFLIEDITMYSKIRKFFILFILLLNSCNSKEKISLLLKSDDKTQIMLGCSYINSQKDTEYVSLLLKDLDDSRISHDVRFNGMSVYQCKINALKRISNIDPPKKVTYKVDTVNINFYKEWAIRSGYLK